MDFMRGPQWPIGRQLLFHSVDWYQIPGALVTKYHKLCGWKQQKLSHNAGSYVSKMEVLAGLVASDGS